MSQLTANKRSFIKRLGDTGSSFALTSSDKRSARITNYFSLMLFFAAVMVLLIRKLFYNISPDIEVPVTALVFLLPVLFNRIGFLLTAKILLCWLPSICIILIYILRDSSATVVQTSEYDSIYMYLLGLAVIPYLVLNLSNQKEFILGISVPSLTVLFFNQLLDLLKIGHSYKGIHGDGYELNYFREIICYFILSGCSIVIRILVENEDHKNTLLIAELEEKNKLIDQRAEEEIRASENMYRSLFEQAADAITLVNANNEFTRVNSKACEMFGYTREEFLKLKLTDVIASEELQQRPIDFEILKSRKTIYRERTLIRKDGSVFPAEVNVRMQEDGSYQSFVRDSTERKKAEEELKEAEGKFRTLIEQSLVGVYIILEDRFVYVNPHFANIFGYTQNELINTLAVDVVQPLERERVNENVRLRLDGERESIHYEVEGIKKNRETVKLEVFGSKIQYSGKPAIIGVLLDVTENKRLQQQVLNQKIQEQKKITRAVLLAEEKERNRIGQEMHDNINQLLIGAKLYLELTIKSLSAEDNLITSSLELINRSIEEVRLLSKSQVTPLKGVGLEELTYSLIDKLPAGTSFKTKILYNIHKEIDEDLKLNIYRIIQEQINNILKHADATQVIISLKDDEAFIYVTVEDNGKGFDTALVRKGIGISNMLNRIESFNGELKIESSSGNGCRLTIRVPY